MPLNFRHFKQILSTWTSYVVGHSSLTDMNPGSVTRTLGEAFSLELSQGYLQIQNLLNLFSVDKASGDDLDERAVDFGAARLQPTKSTGAVTIGDRNLTAANTVTSTLSASCSASASQIAIQTVDFASFPISGSVVLDRGNSLRELVSYTSVTGPNLLNLSTPTVNAHALGVTTNLSTVGADRTIQSGTVVGTTDAVPLRFSITAAATLLDGDYQVLNVPVQSINTGRSYNVNAGTITIFESPPFPTATVTNSSALLGGKDLETDEAFRARIKVSQQSLSSSTKQQIENAALAVATTSGQQVVSAQLVEPVSPGLSILYISDGTAIFTPSQSSVTATEIVIAKAKLGQTRGALANWPIVSGTENLYVSRARGVATATASGGLTDSTAGWTIDQFAGFLLLDGSENFFTVVSNTATVLTFAETTTPNGESYALINPSTAVFPAGSNLVVDTDYTINETNGQFQLSLGSFPAGLLVNDAIIAYAPGPAVGYSYYTGLLQLVQWTINGVPGNLSAYPGVKATGTQVQVQSPTVVDAIISGIIVPNTGVDESTLRLPVQTAIVDYVNSLGIADDVLVSRLIEVAVGVTGVFDFKLINPVDNVVVGNGEIAKTTLTHVAVN